MTHDIQGPTHYVAGESLTQEFTIEEDGSAKDITNSTVSWELVPEQGAPSGAALLSDSDTGVTVSIVDATAGRVDVILDQGTTDGMGGYQYQRLDVDNSGTGLQRWGGEFHILDL